MCILHLVQNTHEINIEIIQKKNWHLIGIIFDSRFCIMKGINIHAKNGVRHARFFITLKTLNFDIKVLRKHRLIKYLST